MLLAIPCVYQSAQRCTPLLCWIIFIICPLLSFLINLKILKEVSFISHIGLVLLSCPILCYLSQRNHVWESKLEYISYNIGQLLIKTQLQLLCGIVHRRGKKEPQTRKLKCYQNFRELNRFTLLK